MGFAVGYAGKVMLNLVPLRVTKWKLRYANRLRDITHGAALGAAVWAAEGVIEGLVDIDWVYDLSWFPFSTVTVVPGATASLSLYVNRTLGTSQFFGTARHEELDMEADVRGLVRGVYRGKFTGSFVKPTI